MKRDNIREGRRHARGFRSLHKDLGTILVRIDKKLILLTLATIQRCMESVTADNRSVPEQGVEFRLPGQRDHGVRK